MNHLVDYPNNCEVCGRPILQEAEGICTPCLPGAIECGTEGARTLAATLLEDAAAFEAQGDLEQAREAREAAAKLNQEGSENA